MSSSFNDDRLSAWLDHELNDGQCRDFEEDLRRDPALKAELEELQRIRDWMRLNGPRQAPDHFVEQLMARIDAEVPVQRSSFAWRRPFGLPLEALAVAALALIVVIGGSTMNFSKNNESAPPSASSEGAAPAAAPVPPPDMKDAPATTSPGSAVVQEKSEYNQDKMLDPSEAEKEPQSLKNAPPSPVETEIIATKPNAQTNRKAEAAPSEPMPMKEQEEIATIQTDDLALPDAAAGASAARGSPKQIPESKTKKSDQAATSADSQWMTPVGRYQLVTTDRSILVDLASMAARFNGQLRDASLNLTQNSELRSDHSRTWYFDIPADQLSNVDRALKQFGLTVVSTVPSSASGRVLLQIDILVIEQPSK